MTISITIDPGGRTKGEIIELAFELCGLPGYEFGREPEEVNAALRHLNAQMKRWPWTMVTYEQPTYGQGAPEDPSGLPDNAVDAVAGELAKRLASIHGKTLSPHALKSITQAYDIYLGTYAPANVPTMKFPNKTARGMGNRSWGMDQPFITEA